LTPSGLLGKKLPTIQGEPARPARLALFFPSSGMQGCRTPVHYAHPMRWS
jgi:hypothetical protein